MGIDDLEAKLRSFVQSVSFGKHFCKQKLGF